MRDPIQASVVVSISKITLISYRGTNECALSWWVLFGEQFVSVKSLSL